MICRKCKLEIPDESVYCLACGVKQQLQQAKERKRTRGNGEGTVYKLPSGKWRAEITLGYDENSKRKCKTKGGFKTKKEALAYIPTLKGESAAPKAVRFSRLYSEWSDIHYQRLSKSKQTAYKIAYKKCAALHYKKISDIRVKDIQEVIDADGAGYYPKHDIKVLCSLIFKYAIQNDYAGKNYAQFVRLPSVPKSTRDAFTAQEVNALWADYRSGNDFTGYILLLIYTGMRLGELQQLKKCNIFLAEGYMIGGIKTEAGIDRRIAISEAIKPIVSEFYMRGKTLLLEMAEKTFYSRYYEALERCKTRRLTPHCCRHTFATRAVEAGISPEIIKALAGHENYETTLQYTHISLDELLRAADRI